MTDPKPPQIEATADALRNTFDEENLAKSWASELSLLGLASGLVGILIWALTSGSQPGVKIINQQPVVVTGLDEALHWVGGALAQGVRAHLLVGEQIRFARSDAPVQVAKASLTANPSGSQQGWQLISRLRQSSQRSDVLQVDIELSHPDKPEPVSYTHLTLPTKRIV